VSSDARVVLCSVPSEEVALTLANTLVEEQLVACVNIVPNVRSIYRWQGKVEDDRELLLVMKTRAERYAELETRVRALHPYEVCELLALDVDAGSAPYLAWLRAETTPSR
jgi:periplasmic divalent cation tolerance protein